MPRLRLFVTASDLKNPLRLKKDEAMKKSFTHCPAPKKKWLYLQETSFRLFSSMKILDPV